MTETPSTLAESQISFVQLFLLTSLFQLGYTTMETLGKTVMSEYELDPFDFAFARNLVNMLIATGYTSFKGLSLRHDGLGARNWKPLLLNGVSAAVAFVISNLVYLYLPLTIFYVLICLMPFALAIL